MFRFLPLSGFACHWIPRSHGVHMERVRLSQTSGCPVRTQHHNPQYHHCQGSASYLQPLTRFGWNNNYIDGNLQLPFSPSPSFLVSLSPFPFLQVLCAWDIYEYILIQTITVKFPFSQRLPDFGPKPFSLLPTRQSLAIACNEYIAEIKLGLAMGNQSDTTVFTSHKHPICTALYNKHFHQVYITLIPRSIVIILCFTWTRL